MIFLSKIIAATEKNIEYSKFSDLGLSCGESTLLSFGVTKEWLLNNGFTGSLIQARSLNVLEKYGYKLEEIIHSWDKPIMLKQFISEHPTGSYFIYTSNHIMSLIDGILTDAERGSGLRRVSHAYKVA